MNRQEFIDKLFAGAKQAGIEECEAYFSSGEGFEVDVLDGAIKEYSVSESSGMCFRGIYQGKMGYASTEIEDEEAIDMLHRFIDEALLLSEKEVRILHGKGYGILMQVIGQELRAMREVRTYHPEKVELGGAGVTVVELR